MRNKFRELEEKSVQTAKAKPKASNLPQEEKKPLYRYPYSFPQDPGSNNSGYYELQAVLTHKGRNIASGHYLAWIKKNKSRFIKLS